MALAEMGRASLELGEYSRAERLFLHSQGEASRLGAQFIASLSSYFHALALWRQGRLEEGRRLFLLAIEGFASRGNRPLEGAAASQRAWA